ncbi:MAG: hypothetical protein HC768_06895 [Acaryochloris sp. CRU_2_0]|nr:hypothetical protein [Acaryochloris sp. CRU_2_0]
MNLLSHLQCFFLNYNHRGYRYNLENGYNSKGLQPQKAKAPLTPAMIRDIVTVMTASEERKQPFFEGFQQILAEREAVGLTIAIKAEKAEKAKISVV